MKAIIVCGMNGSGKTTLAKELTKHFDKTYYHSGLGPNNALELLSCLNTQIAMIDSGVILDRTTLFSEQVYGNGRIIENRFLDNLAKELSDRYILIYCNHVGNIVLKDKYSEIHKVQLIKDNILLRDRYDEVMAFHDVIYYDYETDYLYYIIDLIKERL
jgi:predicted AAA+ superfamily ATPase